MQQPAFPYPNQTSANRKERLKAEAANFDYDYGDLGDKMKPGNELHDSLVNYVLELVHEWEIGSAEYRDDYRRLQWTMTGYVATENKNPRNTSKDKDNMIVLPMTHKNRHMIGASWHSVFIRDPIWRCKPGIGAASLINAATMEHVVQQQALRFDAGLHLHTAVDDALAFGRGTVGTEWKQKRGRKPVDTEITAMAVEMFKAVGGKASKDDINTIKREFKDMVLYEGTQLRPWDPFRTIRDPNTTTNFYQEAEYGGRTYDTNIPTMINRELDDLSHVANERVEGRKANPRYFNAKYVKILADSGLADSYWNGQFLTSGRNDRTGMSNTTQGKATVKTQPVCAIYLEMQIIPKDWNVGDEEYPVKYFIEIAADTIITGFGPLNNGDGNYSWVEFGPNTAGHEISPVGDLMVNFGSHKFANNMVNLAEASFRKSVNGGITVINQDLIDMEHFLNQTTPHKLAIWAKPFVSPEQAQSAIMNFPHMDNSSQQLALISQLMAWDADGLGTNNLIDSLQAERTTKAAVNTANYQQNSRMAVWCYKFGAQGMQDLFWRYAYNQVQYGSLSEEMSYAQGRFADRIRRELGKNPTGLPWEIDPQTMTATVDPSRMSLEFNMEPFTGSMPGLQDTSGLEMILQQALAIPEVAAETFTQLPVAQLLLTYLRMNDVPDVDAYAEGMQASAAQGPVQNVQVAAMPDEMLQERIQAGEYQPIPMDRQYA